MKKIMAILGAALLASTLCSGQIIRQKEIDGGGSGPYKALATTEASLSNYVIYRPADLAAAVRGEGKLPILVFANGGCGDTSITHERVLSELASHGYIVIAIGAMQQELSDRKIVQAPNAMLIGGIDWIVDKSADPSSEFYQMVDIEKIATGGQSCGGAQVLATAADPRIKTYVMFNTGMGEISMSGASKASLRNVHGPIIYIIGGKSDVAYVNAQGDYENISSDKPIVFADLTKGGHMGTFGDLYGGSFAKMVVDWLDWQFKGKDRANLFLRHNLKEYPGWTIKSKNF